MAHRKSNSDYRVTLHTNGMGKRLRTFVARRITSSLRFFDVHNLWQGMAAFAITGMNGNLTAYMHGLARRLLHGLQRKLYGGPHIQPEREQCSP